MDNSLTVLIARTDSRLEGFSSGFRDNRAQFDSGDVVVFLLALAALITVLWLVARWSERRVRSDSSLGLFLTLAKAHAVGWGDRWLLWRIARAKGVTEPALLFLDPRLTSPQASYHLAPQSADRLKALRRQFFSGIDRPEETTAETTAETEHADKPFAASDTTTTPSEPEPGQIPTFQPTGDLAEALGAMRALSLKDQPARREGAPEEPPVDRKKEPTIPTADFPASDTPALDLYPWLSNDWEITSTDD